MTALARASGTSPATHPQADVLAHDTLGQPWLYPGNVEAEVGWPGSASGPAGTS